MEFTATAATAMAAALTAAAETATAAATAAVPAAQAAASSGGRSDVDVAGGGGVTGAGGGDGGDVTGAAGGGVTGAGGGSGVTGAGGGDGGDVTGAAGGGVTGARGGSGVTGAGGDVTGAAGGGVTGAGGGSGVTGAGGGVTGAAGGGGGVKRRRVEWRDHHDFVAAAIQDMRNDERFFDATIVCGAGAAGGGAGGGESNVVREVPPPPLPPRAAAGKVRAKVFKPQPKPKPSWQPSSQPKPVSGGGAVRVRAHKLILAAVSPFFRSRLATEPVIWLDGARADLVTALVEFIYTGETTLPEADLRDFTALARRLQIQGLPWSETETSGEHEASSAATVKSAFDANAAPGATTLAATAFIEVAGVPPADAAVDVKEPWLLADAAAGNVFASASDAAQTQSLAADPIEAATTTKKKRARTSSTAVMGTFAQFFRHMNVQKVLSLARANKTEPKPTSSGGGGGGHGKTSTTSSSGGGGRGKMSSSGGGGKACLFVGGALLPNAKIKAELPDVIHCPECKIEIDLTQVEVEAPDPRDVKDEVSMAYETMIMRNRDNSAFLCTAFGCGYESKKSNNVREHVEAKHVQMQRKYQCPYCPAIKRTSATFRLHCGKDHRQFPKVKAEDYVVQN